MRRPHRSTLLLLALAAAPAAFLLFASLLLQVLAYTIYHELPLRDSVQRVSNHFVTALEPGGWPAISLLALNYVTIFGLLAATAVLALQWFNRRRVRCFYLVGCAALVSFHLWTQCRPGGLVWLIHLGPEFSDSIEWLPWYVYLVFYPRYALPLALLAGAAVAALPLFRESPLVALQRGVCPKCHYDLRDSPQEGCPECGWNRRRPDTNREHILIPQRIALRTRRIWLAAAWSIVLLVLMSMNVFTIRSMVPRVTSISHLTGLGRPSSEAYGALDINLDLRHVSGWFERSGRMTRTKWTLTVIPPETLDQRQDHRTRIARAPLTPEQRSALEPPPIGRLWADSLAGTMVIECGDETQHETLSAESLADWFIWLFPEADPNRLAREAEGVLEMVHFESEQTVLTAITKRRATPGWLPKGFHQGSGHAGTKAHQRLWYPGVAIVAGVVLAIWFAGAGVIWRWTKPKLGA